MPPDAPIELPADRAFEAAGGTVGLAANVPGPALRSSRRRRRAEIAILVDPRFPGGTAGAVAAEIAALAPHAAIEVHALRTRMFRERGTNAKLAAAIEAHGLTLIEDAPVIRAETIVLHNPSCLKRDSALHQRLSCARAFVVCHENFLRPGGSEGFDVGHCLGLIDAALACGAPLLAPISPWNRDGVLAWQARAGGAPGADWPVTPVDWFNVIDLPARAPSGTPRDRRGRHSRPGFEKFPPLDRLRAQFPAEAEACVILGADNLIADPESPRHWRLLPFGAMEPAHFLAEIDFFVYFTNPLWQESFGRVIAEAIAAGKVVITDPVTASAFGPAVVADAENGQGGNLARVIEGFIADPAGYQAFVRDAQARLARFRPDAFARQTMFLLETSGEVTHAAL